MWGRKIFNCLAFLSFMGTIFFRCVGISAMRSRHISEVPDDYCFAFERRGYPIVSQTGITGVPSQPTRSRGSRASRHY